MIMFGREVFLELPEQIKKENMNKLATVIAINLPPAPFTVIDIKLFTQLNL